MNSTKSIPLNNIPLVQKHIPYAKKLARQFYLSRKHLGIDLDDFEGSALLGLCDAACSFKPEHGTDFTSYAYLRIRGEMYDLLRTGSGMSRRDFNTLFNRETSQLDSPEGSRYAKPLPYAPAKTPLELLSLSEILSDAGLKVFYNPKRKNIALSYAQNETPEDIAVSRAVKQELASLIEQLPEKHRAAIKHEYWEEPQESISRMSRSGVWRIRARALAELRALLVPCSKVVKISADLSRSKPSFPLLVHPAFCSR